MNTLDMDSILIQENIQKLPKSFRKIIFYLPRIIHWTLERKIFYNQIKSEYIQLVKSINLSLFIYLLFWEIRNYHFIKLFINHFISIIKSIFRKKSIQISITIVSFQMALIICLIFIFSLIIALHRTQTHTDTKRAERDRF